MAGPLDLARLMTGPAPINPEPVIASAVKQGDELAADRRDDAPVIGLAAKPDHDCRPGLAGDGPEVGEDLPNRSSFAAVEPRDHQVDTVAIGHVGSCGLGQ